MNTSKKQVQTMCITAMLAAFAMAVLGIIMAVYNYKKQSIADKKVEQILSRYNLNFPEGQDLNTMVAGKPKLINKLQNLELGTKTQEELVDYGEEMGLDLMTTDDGAIIIMDSKDIDTFVGLLNDDFMTSDLTGLKYEIKSKKLLEQRDSD